MTGKLIYNVIRAFLRHGYLLKELNDSYITLIPKRKNLNDADAPNVGPPSDAEQNYAINASILAIMEAILSSLRWIFSCS